MKAIIIAVLAATAACGDVGEYSDASVEPRELEATLAVEAAELSTKRCDVQRFRAQSQAQLDALASKFLAQNPGFQFKSPGFPIRSATLGIVADAWDPSPIVPGESAVTYSDATRASIEFVRSNAEFFGLSAEDVANARVSATPGIAGSGYVWLTHVEGTRPGPLASEGVEGLDRVVFIYLSVGSDGRVRNVSNHSYGLFPSFSLDMTSVLPITDPAVLGKVYEVELEHTFWEGIYIGSPVQKVIKYGRPTSADIRAITLVGATRYHHPNSDLTVQLAYSIDVVRGDRKWGFRVDACTGELLDVSAQ